MKKLIPFISPLVCGIFGGLFIECVMCILSAVVSPFADFEQVPFLTLLFLIAILSALFTIVMVVVNIAYLINLNNKRKAKITVILEVVVGIVILFISWSFLDPIISSGLYNLF